MPNIKVNLRVRAFKRVIPVFGKKAPPPMKVNCLPFLGYEKWEALLWLETLCTTSV